MELTRFSPARDVFRFPDHLSGLFGSFFAPTGEAAGAFSTWRPKVDIYDEKDQFVVKAELPGIDKKDIHVNVKGRALTLKGETRSENEEKKDKCCRRERFHGKFERSFTLPGEVKAESIKADYTDGLLEISIPKPEENQETEVAIH
ncbi:conserved hypothetical protein [Candidatus Desulfarcum epimagneticum]|uniref:Uncharacterized protein n=1 Tax=uncultured Desulfobacteraceae bacterium TaxID=218296 RepID=A0A484HK40_9BACT|nr:conserved hypothetical protein [uncultured Desulfobacteraceae bacterium]